MLRFLPMPVRTFVGILGFVGNTLFWCVVLFAVALVKITTRSAERRLALSATLAEIAQRWIGVNTWLIDNLITVRWEVSGLEGLDPHKWYLVVSNHRSGLDIPVLQRVFHRRIPFIRFFLKKNLIWVPILGQAWWALDYPFMNRHSAAALARNPALRAQDREATHQACARFQHMPTAILNFVEGTRFTPEKHAQQNSPYLHLLKPKVGGIAHAIEAMGSRFAVLLDVTLCYPDGDVGLWDFARGRVRRIVVHVEPREIPHQLLEGDYLDDEATRDLFRAWIDGLWQEKDALLESILGNGTSASALALVGATAAATAPAPAATPAPVA